MPKHDFTGPHHEIPFPANDWYNEGRLACILGEEADPTSYKPPNAAAYETFLQGYWDEDEDLGVVVWGAVQEHNMRRRLQS